MDRKWIGAKFALAIGIAAIPTMPMQTIAAEDNSADWPVGEAAKLIRQVSSLRREVPLV
jgi:hypothetical protein